ncbi:MAG: hypothetical protein ABS36_01310 [Acidobacteria bacterium SCN 69-37]|nr:MAG: hypothetical protein ABS36_01310 [Acidobacteria bacterium SCN 69-37]
MLCLAPSTAVGQATGTVAGTIQDSSGGVIPGAVVVLISETRGTRGVPAITNATGDYVLPNITPDTYSIEVTMPGFRTARRTGVPVSGGERVAVGILVIEPGGASETVDVTAEAPLIQAQSGERSQTISSIQVESLPLGGGRNFTDLTRLVPGVMVGGASAGGTRIGGAGQNNITMDGVSAMDTGSNTQMLNLNVEAIAEVKVLTQGYQAEYGRASGLQIAAVTKGGTNQFRGSVYDIEDNSDWNTNSWQNQQNGVAKPVSKSRRWGYSLGGPVGRPGGDNKLFFFYSHEYFPQQTSGVINRFRVPTALERMGNFSESLDNQGRPIPQLRDPLTREPYPDNIIPRENLYETGLRILNSYPEPNVAQTVPNAWNLELARPIDKNLTHQPSVRVDYQLTPGLRFNARWAGQRARERIVEGTMPGYNDILVPYPYRHVWGATANWTINATTFLEATYGETKNELAGGNAGGFLSNSASDRLAMFPDLPMIYPDAGWVDPRYYQHDALTRAKAAGGAAYFDGTSVNLIPVLQWGGLIGSAPPDLTYPGWVTLNLTRDVSVSLTKVAGRHTFKAGFYNNYAYKPQNTGQGGGGGGSAFHGTINFGNNTNNPLDTGFGFANAATGVFTTFSQASRLIEANTIYNNTEFYAQDNWRMTNRLTIDYGMRFTRQQPTYDTFEQMTNFFPNLWNVSAAPLLYVPGCRNNAAICSGNNRMAMNPVTGQILDNPNVLSTSSAVATVIPGSGDPINGIRQAGQGIAKESYVWPALVFGPRFGFAYDLTGTQGIVVRGGAGLFYDRPDGNTTFSIPSNPPIAESAVLTNARLQTLDEGFRTSGASNLVVFQYEAKIPSSVQWNLGVQMALPWASTIDVSYVGNHGYNMLGAFQGGAQVNLNQVNLGAAYLPENQDTTQAPSATPGGSALPTNLLRPFRGFGSIGQHTTEFSDTYHSIQTSFNRRFRSGISFGLNYTYSISLVGNTGLTWRLQHAPDGSFTVRSDQARYEELNKNLSVQPHVLRGNVVWDLPDLLADNGVKRVLGYLVNDWQLSSIFNLSSGPNYDLSFSYQNNGSAVNLTGSPDFANNTTGARVVFLGDPGSGCSGDQYRQFNAMAVTGPSFYSVGLDSGRNAMRGCVQRDVDISLARNIRLGGGRNIQLRMDAFNAFNIVTYTNRQGQIQMNNPVQKTVINSQYLADGSMDPGRTRPQNAGFGAVTSAANMRSVRLTLRFGF